jgi:hypothetical protein
MRKLLWLCVLLFAAAAMQAPTAIEQLNALLEQAQSTKKAGDMQAHLAAVLKLQGLLNHSPEAVESAAQAYAAAGDDQQALDSLQEFAAMGQTDEKLIGGKRQEFSRFASNPRYAAIVRQLKANNSTVERAELAFTVSDQGLLPEDIDYDPTSRSFLITSILEKKIVRLSPDGRVSDFAQSPSHWPMLAIKIDAARGLVWATEVGLDGFAIVPKDQWGRSAVLCFSLGSGKLVHRIEGPAHTSLGDMSLAPDGTPIVSAGDGGGLYRLAGDRLELIDDHDFISPQTTAPVAGTSSVLVPDYTRGIGLLDLTTGKIVWLMSRAKTSAALNGVDGLYYTQGMLILTQNGTSPERVVQFRLDKTLAGVDSEEVIEQDGSNASDPTHGVIVGRDFYFIANSGWNNLDDHGDLKPGSHPTPARIMRYKLRPAS